jgi:hypothetical protein
MSELAAGDSVGGNSPAWTWWIIDSIRATSACSFVRIKLSKFVWTSAISRQGRQAGKAARRGGVGK